MKSVAQLDINDMTTPTSPRIVFMGSPEFSVPSLQALAAHYNVVGVVTQPDRPAGRGQTLTPPPVKVLARQLRLPIIQPPKLRLPEAMQQLHDWQPDLIVVTAFGQILRREVLELPAYGCINVHASLLPRWRGAAPINSAILHGDPYSGVTIMRMDAGVDTGPLISQRSTAIGPDETATRLAGRLAVIGADLLVESLPGYLSGELAPQLQDESLATYAPMLKKEDGDLDFRLSAAELERKVRAFQPWPGAFTTWLGGPLKVQQARAIFDPQNETDLSPGTHTIYQGLPAICTTQGLLVLEELQPAGKKSMAGKIFLQGARNWL
jgi:methionyl-tRNA formyltransferase